MPYASTVRSAPTGVGDANRTATRRTRPGSPTPTRPRRRWVQIAMVHSPWVNKKSKPVPRRVDIEVVRRPVAGHLGVAVGQTRVDVLRHRSDRIVSGRIGEAVIVGHRSQVGHAVQSEQHGGPPLFDGHPALGIGLFDVQHDLRTSATRRSHRRELRPGLQRLVGDRWAMQYDTSCSPCTPPCACAQAAAGTSPLAASYASKARMTG